MANFTLPVCTPIFSSSAEVPKIFDASLPEYCSGIQRIIKTQGLIETESTSFSDGIIFAHLKAQIKVLYIAEQSGFIKSIVFPYEFEHSFDASRIPLDNISPTFEVRPQIIAVNAKPKGSRNLEIKMNLSVDGTIYDCSASELFPTQENMDIELKKTPVACVCRTMISDIPEKIREDITIDADMPSISEICDYSCVLLTENVSASQDTIIFDGKAIIKCTYRAESTPEEEKNEYIYITKALPFRTEVSAENIKQDDIISAGISLCAFEVSSSFDPYGENRIINTSIGYELHFDIFSEFITEYADDAYCALYQCNFSKTEMSYDKFVSEIKHDTEISERTPSEKGNIAHITDVSLNLCPGHTEISSDNMIYLLCKAVAYVDGLDDKENASCLQTVFNCKIPVCEAPDAASTYRFVLNPQVLSCNATLQDGDISINAKVGLHGVVLENKKFTCIDTANISYDSPKPICRSEYIIYYPSKDETLWDIAKKYEIPQSEIAYANGFNDSFPSDKKTVIIPCRI